MNKKAMYKLSYGLFVLTAKEDVYKRQHSGSPLMITSYQMEPIRRTYPCIGKMIQKKQLRFIKQALR